jgi:DnaK suppressor protein
MGARMRIEDTSVKKSKKAGAGAKPAKAPDPKDKNETARKILLDMRERILAGGPKGGIPESLRMANDDIGEEADRAGTENTREVSILLSARNKERLPAIEEALEKIGEGRYGLCEECGDHIGPARLKAMPLARYCVACQSVAEKEMNLDKMGASDSQPQGFAVDFEEEKIN